MARALGHEAAAPSGGNYAFVGRRRELGLLLAAVRRPPAVVLVEGEAGIGKSRMVREAAETLRAERRPVLTGFCHPLREPFPYGPVIDALRRAGHRLPPAGIPPTAGALAPLLPDLADRLPPPPPRPRDPQAERHQLLQAVHSFLTALGPAVLVVEDLHWVDDATRELLLLLARDLPEQLSLVLTYRAEDLPPRTPVLGAAYRHPHGTSGTTIALSPLTEPEIGELAADALGPYATPALARALYDRSQGLPLVAEEDLITLGEHGRHGNGTGTGTGADAVAELERAQVPRGLREAVTERLTALSPAGAAVVDAAAVLAVPADEALLTAVAGLAPEDGAHGLTEALQASVLRESGSGQYVFRHVLAQQVAYGHVPGPRRTRLHRQAVAELEQLLPVPLVQIAHHTLALGDRRAWLRRAEAAADQALALGDTGTSAELLQQILEQPDPDQEVRSRAALALARIAVNGVDPTANAEALRRLLADPQLPEATCGEIRLGLGLLILNHGGDRSGYEELKRAITELTTRPERAARAMTALALNEREAPSEQAWHWVERAEHTLRDSPSEAMRATVRATRLTLLAREGDPAVWRQLEQLPREAEDKEILRQTTRALYNVGDIAIELGHDARARTLLTESRELARRAGIPHLECYSRIALVRLDGLAGHLTGVEERFAELGTQFPDIAMVTQDQTLFLGRLAAARGQLTRAVEQFTTAADYGQRETQVTAALHAAAGLAGLRLAQSAPEDAWAIAAPAVAMLRRAGAWARATGLLPVAVEAALACGHRRDAELLADDAESGLRDRDAPGAVAELRTAQGLLHQDGRPTAAAKHFADAARLWREIGLPYETAQATERHGLALAVTQPEEATRHLTEALDGFTRLGATGDLARCRHLLTELGLVRAPARGRRGYGDQLSPREDEVAQLLARGATNQDIAQTLFLSPRTVEQHVAHVLKKLDTTRKGVHQALRNREAADG